MKKTEIAIWLGALAGVGLLLLVVFREESGGSGGKNTTTVWQVSGITPEVASIRANERVAMAQTKKDSLLGYFAYALGIKNADVTREVSILDSNNRVKISEYETTAAKDIAIAGYSSNERVAQTNAFSAAEVARIQADAQKTVAAKQASAQKTSSIAGTVGSVIGTIAKVFKFL